MFNYDFIINFLTFLYIIIKLLRIIFFTRLILEFLPIFNIFEWPTSTIYKISSPLIKSIRYFIPTIKIGIIELEFYLIITFELFIIILNFIEKIRNKFIELKLLQLIELQ